MSRLFFKNRFPLYTSFVPLPASLAVSQNRARWDKLQSLSKARTTRRWMKTRGNGTRGLRIFNNIPPRQSFYGVSSIQIRENGESKARATSPSLSRFHFRSRVIASYSQEFNFARFSLADRVKDGKSPRFRDPFLDSESAFMVTRGGGGRRRGGDRSKLKNV